MKPPAMGKSDHWDGNYVLGVQDMLSNGTHENDLDIVVEAAYLSLQKLNVRQWNCPIIWQWVKTWRTWMIPQNEPNDYCRYFTLWSKTPWFEVIRPLTCLDPHPISSLDRRLHFGILSHQKPSPSSAPRSDQRWRDRSTHRVAHINQVLQGNSERLGPGNHIHPQTLQWPPGRTCPH